MTGQTWRRDVENLGPGVWEAKVIRTRRTATMVVHIIEAYDRFPTRKAADTYATQRMKALRDE